MKRTFFAIRIRPGDIVDQTIMLIRKELVRERIKWVSIDDLHLTLKFLGDTREEEIPAILESVYDQLKEAPVMKLHLFSLGLFRNLYNPRVIWIGIKPDPGLLQTQKRIEKCLLPFGFHPEDQKFFPHFTLGRVKEIKERDRLGNLIERFKNESFGIVTVSEIIFYESILKPECPLYSPLKVFPLAVESDAGSLNNGKSGIDKDFQVNKN
jgi:2'-5' RNA ligase